IPERQHPIMVNRIVYYEDPYFRGLMAAQKGPLPYPSRAAEDLRNLRDKVAALTDQTQKLLAYPEAKGQRNGGLPAAHAGGAGDASTASAAASPPGSALASVVMTEAVPADTGLTDEELGEALRPAELDALKTMQSIEVKLRRKLGG
ncbi:hypothetical protein, partial [Paracoccus laeviglucosivorans]